MTMGKDTYANRHSISRGELIKLISDTGGRHKLKWYACQSGYSMGMISKIRAELGFDKKPSTPSMIDSDEFKAMKAFADCVMKTIDGSTTEDRIVATIAEVREAYPGHTGHQMNLLRRHLRGLSAHHSSMIIDRHSGFIEALRVPLNQIAEVM